MLSPTRTCSALLAFGLAVWALGCGDPQKARAVVKGKVAIGAKSLTTGSVMFYGKDNVTGSATIDLDGNYVMNDAPLGDVKISIFVPKPPMGGMKGGALKGMKDTKSVDPEGSGKSISIMSAMPTHVVPIPDRYANYETSGLTYKVEKGEHTHDLLLTP